MKEWIFYAVFAINLFLPELAKCQEPADVYYFDYMDHRLEDPDIDENYLKEHPFGKEVAIRVEAVKQKYTYVVEGSATAPQDRRIVEKPVLYYAVQKLDNFYKKQVKKGGMNSGKATEKLVFALDVAMLIRYQQTEQLEKDIKKLKGGEEIARFFDDRVKIRF
ncbi:MAG: hypothetical protein AAGC88_09695 [Bacteroidota bacterium]